MTPNGYIPIPRELFSDGYWAEEREYTKAEALIYLFAKAAYKPSRPIVSNKPLDVQPGQLPASVRYLMAAWKWSNTKVERFLEELQAVGIIDVEKKTGQNLVTVSFLNSYYADLSQKTTEKRQKNDAETTEKRQRNDEIEESNKVINKKGEVGASPAPLFNPSILQSSNPSKPGTTEFDLLRRIGKPAAQIWTQGSAADHFDTPGHAALALDWMEHLCRKQRPLQSQQELSALIAQFKGKHLDELKAIAQYSYTGGYTALYFDRLAKKTNGNRHNLDPKDIENSRKNAKITPSGMKLL
jgi:ribosomal protein L12E/L44/L45/RPP1/RPP2